MSKAENDDRLFVNEQSIHCSIGLTAEERAYPQRILLSTQIGLSTPMAEIGRSVDLSRGVCYATLAARFNEHARSRSWTLVEELAESLAELGFREFPAVNVIQIEIQKFVVPETSSVGIRITRLRRE